MKRCKSLAKGCVGYLASIVTSTSPELDVHNISVVCEYPDDLPDMPPHREVEFSIKLVLGSGTVSKLPYRMAPVELRELKTQLQELQDKGFIRPNVSPLGAPVLFICKKDGSLQLCIDYRMLN